MTLQAKTERLERELRVMGDRLRTLETRNKDLEAVNREEWVRPQSDLVRYDTVCIAMFSGSNNWYF